jgi:hypothetical protein
MSWRPRRHCLPRHDDPRWIQLDRICIGGCSNVTTPSFRRWGVRNCAGDVDQPADGIGRSFDAWVGSVENHPFAWRMRFRDTVDTAEVAAIRCEVATQSRAAALPLLARRPKNRANSRRHRRRSQPVAWEVVPAVCTGWWCGVNPDIARVHNVSTDLFDEALAIEVAHDSDTDF